MDRRQFGGARSAIAPADGSPGMADGGSGDADTSNSGPTWSASEANLRDHAVRQRKRQARSNNRRSGCPDKFVTHLRGARTSAGVGAEPYSQRAGDAGKRNK
jgi:hypothetical protein